MAQNTIVDHSRCCHGRNWEKPLSSSGCPMAAAVADDNDYDDEEEVVYIRSADSG